MSAEPAPEELAAALVASVGLGIVLRAPAHDMAPAASIGLFVLIVGGIVLSLELRWASSDSVGGVEFFGNPRRRNLAAVFLGLVGIPMAGLVAGAFSGSVEVPPVDIWGGDSPWLLVLVPAAAVIEEVVFRGWALLRLLRMRAVHSGLALVFSSGLFGAAHLPNSTSAIYALCTGTVYGGLTLWTRSIIPAVVVHTLSNAAVFLLVP